MREIVEAFICSCSINVTDNKRIIKNKKVSEDSAVACAPGPPKDYGINTRPPQKSLLVFLFCHSEREIIVSYKTIIALIPERSGQKQVDELVRFYGYEKAIKFRDKNLFPFRLGH